MSEKTEWEIVDAAPDASESQRQQTRRNAQQAVPEGIVEENPRQFREQFHARYRPGAGAPPDVQQSLQALLGPWWRWKIAGAALTLVVVLVLVATLAGAVLLVVTAVALTSIAVAKLRQWLRRVNTSA